MRVLINGIGCTYTGAKLVLDQILNAAPTNIEVTVIVPVLNDSINFEFPNHIKVIKFKHSIWGMYLRIFLELYLNLLMWLKKYDRLINLSHYGLCLTKKQVLYIHNPFILDMHAPTSIGQGNPNKLVRLALNTCIRNAEEIFLQTEHMYNQMQEYCTINSLKFPKSVKILRPPFPAVLTNGMNSSTPKTYDFQFFYPASHFPHKRIDLAINSVLAARKLNGQVGLVITTNSSESNEGVKFIGSITNEQVYCNFKTSDALLFTSERETLGLPLLEAIHFGKPAVLPNKAYAKEIYDNAAVYYNENTAEAICSAIIMLMDNYPYYLERVKEQKEKLLKTRISWEQHWDIFLDLELQSKDQPSYK